MKKVHFIGIGGIGISAIAKFLHEKKTYEITGSDIKDETFTKPYKAISRIFKF